MRPYVPAERLRQHLGPLDVEPLEGVRAAPDPFREPAAHGLDAARCVHAEKARRRGVEETRAVLVTADGTARIDPPDGGFDDLAVSHDRRHRDDGLDARRSVREQHDPPRDSGTAGLEDLVQALDHLGSLGAGGGELRRGSSFHVAPLHVQHAPRPPVRVADSARTIQRVDGDRVHCIDGRTEGRADGRHRVGARTRAGRGPVRPEEDEDCGRRDHDRRGRERRRHADHDPRHEKQKAEKDENPGAGHPLHLKHEAA